MLIYFYTTYVLRVCIKRKHFRYSRLDKNTLARDLQLDTLHFDHMFPDKDLYISCSSKFYLLDNPEVIHIQVYSLGKDLLDILRSMCKYHLNTEHLPHKGWDYKDLVLRLQLQMFRFIYTLKF